MEDSKVQIIRAHGIEIVDDQGLTRIKLYTKNESSVIELYNSKGKSNLGLEVNENQSGIWLRNIEGEVRAFIGIVNDQPGICFYSSEEQIIFEIHIDYNIGIVIRFFDKIGRHKFSFVFNFLNENESTIWLFDEMDKGRISISLIDNNPSIAFYDKLGKQRLVLGIGQREAIGVWLNDLHEKPQIIIASDYNGIPRLWLYGEEMHNLD